VSATIYSVPGLPLLTGSTILATLATADYLTERAKRGSREKLLAVLAKAPDVEPEDYDKL
jgi:hypothetical protein